jgi:hypothetical protein
MKLVLIRDQSDIDGTFGKLYINGLFQCHTLEDMDRHLEDGGKKVPAQTAIPRGEYKVIIDFSNRFKKEMMHVLDVPQFAGIRIHSGNTHEDTEGCILLGNGRNTTSTYLLDSRNAVNKVFNAVEFALDHGQDVTLEVK